MNNNTEKIGRYLQNEMSAEEMAAFENQLAYDKELQEELAIQKQIIAVVNGAGLKNSFGKAIRTRFISRLVIRWGVVAIVITGLVFYAIKTNLLSTLLHDREIVSIVPASENFVIDNSADTVIETDEGVVFGIPANAFDSKNKKIRLEIKTAVSPEKIMLQGLSTTSNGELLQTAGMFYINGFDNDKPVSLKKKIDVSVPTKNVNPAMQLFSGVQDSSGKINWVNPKPIEKRLRTYDITTLDFYPPYYIPVLKALAKDYTNKKYTDSLYYSFSGFPEKAPGPVAAIPDVLNKIEGELFEERIVADGKTIFHAKCASCHTMGNDGATGPDLRGVIKRWPSKQALKEWILNWPKAAKKYPYAATMAYSRPGVQQVYEGQLTDAELDILIKWIDEWQPSFDSDTTKRHFDILKDSLVYQPHEIDPSRIRAIWDKKFNNTIIATKEFAERLRFMHTVCSPAFLAYLQNLNKPMYEIDQMIADNAGDDDAVHHKFLEFAARKDGGVMIKDGTQEKLSAYFEKKLKAYREATAKTWAKHEDELARLAAIADDKRREQETKDFLRKGKILQEEFCINLTDAYRQIGVRRTCKDTIPTPPPATYYNTQIDTLGWKNLDMYVMEATTTRENMTYTDPDTGKTATITYKDVSIIIENQQQYDRVFVYLLPDGLTSFQRIGQYGNVFSEKLNMLFKYDAVAIGFKGEKTYFYKQSSLQPGQYTFRLSAITEKELKQLLKSVEKDKSDEMFNEYEFQLFEQQEIRREVQLRRDRDFRTQIMTVIWPCGEGRFAMAEGEDMGVPVADSTSTPAIK